MKDKFLSQSDSFALTTNKFQKWVKKVSNIYQKAEAITELYCFNEFGFKTGKTALQKKKELFQIQ